MMCQHCHKNEATNHFVVNFMGVEHEVRLCDACTGQLQRWAGNIQRHMAEAGESSAAPWWQTATQAAEARQEPPFPQNAGEWAHSRRRLNQLRVRLEKAVEMEQFELAARLRDELEELEKEVLKNRSALRKL